MTVSIEALASINPDLSSNQVSHQPGATVSASQSADGSTASSQVDMSGSSDTKAESNGGGLIRGGLAATLYAGAFTVSGTSSAIPLQFNFSVVGTLEAVSSLATGGSLGTASFDYSISTEQGETAGTYRLASQGGAVLANSVGNQLNGSLSISGIKINVSLSAGPVSIDLPTATLLEEEAGGPPKLTFGDSDNNILSNYDSIISNIIFDEGLPSLNIAPGVEVEVSVSPIYKFSGSAMLSGTFGGPGNIIDVATNAQSASTSDASGSADVTLSGLVSAQVPYDYAGNTAYLSIQFDNGRKMSITRALPPAPCFAQGMLIETPRGLVAVEDLRVGECILTASGIEHPIIWIGHRHVACYSHPDPQAVWPICITAGTFAPTQPQRDLYLSPDHAIFAGGILIPIKHLINGTTITQEPRDEVTYYHIELDHHDVILAEGLPCESYLDNGSRTAFANGGVVMQLHPDFCPAERCEATGEAFGCAPLRIVGREVDRVRARLRHRAAKLGHAAVGTKRIAEAKSEALSFDLTVLLRPDWYLGTNPDVAAAGIDPAAHYARHGRQEGRQPCLKADLIRGLGLIDPATVIRTMPDVVAAGADPVEHFCTHGWREGRRPNAYFATAWYRATHSVPADMNPLVHYVLFGEPAGLAPSQHFDPAWYCSQYGLASTMSPLAHYLQHRRTQKFSPLPGFDVAVYCEKHATNMLSGRDPYAHFLAIGRFAPATEERAAA